MSNQGKELFEFGPFRLDPAKRVLLRDHQPVPLQLKAFETLLVLVRQSEQVVLKDDLMKAVWPDTFVEESNLAQQIFVLRKTLGDAPGDNKYIVTIPGRGYRFAAKTRIITDEEESLTVESSRSRLVIAQSTRHPRPAIAVAGVFLVLALSATAGYRYHRSRSTQSSTASPVVALKPRRSVAVLGFQNLSGRSDPAWLSTAFSEMLITELGAGDQLRTVSSEEVAHLKSGFSPVNGSTLSKDTLARIHQTLGADVVVLGSYSDLGKQAGGQIRLDVRLQDTAAGETIASISETGTEAALFSMVARTGARLREKLAVPALSSGESESVLASLPSDTEAARLYAEGLEKLRQYDALAARDLLQQAIHADSAFALAHSALAEAWSQLGYEKKATSEAKTAFELSDKLPHKDHLFIEARYRAMSKEWGAAQSIYRTLFDFFPDDIEYGLRLADAQTKGGKGTDAIATFQSLRKLQPPARNDARIDLAEELNYLRLGQYSTSRDLSIRTVDKTRASGFDVLLARALYLEAATLAPLGEGDKAIAAAEEAKAIYDRVGDRWGASNALEYIGYVYSSRGEWERAEKLDQRSLALNRSLGNQTGAAIDLAAIAAIRQSRGDIEGGRKMDEEALAIYREVGDRSREAWALMGLAWSDASEGNFTAAMAMDNQALAIFNDVADSQGAAYALEEKASELTMLGDLPKAEDAAHASLAMAQKYGDQNAVVGDLFYLGNIAKLKGTLGDAEKAFSQSLTLAHAQGMDSQTVENEIGLGEIAVEQSQPQEAKKQIDAALSYVREHKDPGDEVGAQVMLARLDLAQGNTLAASHAMDAANTVLRHFPQDREAHLIFGITEARIQAATGKPAAARRTLDAVLADTRKYSFVRYQLEARLAMCEVEAKTDPAIARIHAKSLQNEAGSKGFGLIARKALALSGTGNDDLSRQARR